MRHNMHYTRSLSRGWTAPATPAGLLGSALDIPARVQTRRRCRPYVLVASLPPEVAVELWRASVGASVAASPANPVSSIARQIDTDMGTAIGGGLLLSCILAPMFVGMAYLVWDSLLEGRVFKRPVMKPVGQDECLRRDVVRKATTLAADVHNKQGRKLESSKRAHCFEMARTTERLIAMRRTGWDKEQKEAVVVAAFLHALLDDLPVPANAVASRFGQSVADITAALTRLSDTAQLLRCRLSFGARDEYRREEDAEKVREVDAVYGARLVKLTDRLHKMRGLWARPPDQRAAFAHETLQVWVPLAERAQLWALKSELEDLSFAVLDPEKFDRLHAHVSATWGSREPQATAPATPPLPARPPQEPSFARHPAAQPIIVDPRRPNTPPRPAYAGKPSYAETELIGGSHANILPMPARHSLGRMSLSAAGRGPALPALSGEQGGGCAALTEPLSARRTAILSVPQRSAFASAPACAPRPGFPGPIPLDGDSCGSFASAPHPILLGRIPLEGEVAGYQNPEGSCSTSGVSLDRATFSRGRDRPKEFWNPKPFPVAEPCESHGSHGRQALHVKQLGFARVDAVEPVQNPERPGGLQEVLESARQWLESVGALPTEHPARQKAETLMRQNPSLFRGTFFSDGKVQLEAEGEKRRDGCVVWKFPHPEPPMVVPDEEQLPVHARLKSVVPFDEVSFAIDLPSKEKAQPPSMFRAAREVLGLPPPLDNLPRPGSVSVTEGAALPILATNGLADEPRSHLALLKRLARELLKELRIEGVLSGVDVRIAGRVKSLYSTHRKMARKGMTVRGVYDALALRIIVDDSDGDERQAAVQACYRMLPAIHRLWTPVHEEFDDYITQPKASGYQSLHTTVMVGDVALEVQVRTRSMDAAAEDGKAAHGYYKDSVILRSGPPAASPISQVRVPAAGDSVMKISGRSDLHAGVVLRVDHGQEPRRRTGGRRSHATGRASRPQRAAAGDKNAADLETAGGLLRTQRASAGENSVADLETAGGLLRTQHASAGGKSAAELEPVSEIGQRDVQLLVAVNTRSSPLQGELKGVTEDSRKLADLVAEKGWWHPGHGNFEVKLETYRLCEADGQYHFVDQYGRMGPAVVKTLKWDEVDEAFRLPPEGLPDSTQPLQARVSKLRRDLAAAKAGAATGPSAGRPRASHVVVLLFLSDDLVRAESFPAGTTAGSALSMSQGKLGGPGARCVMVNNQWVAADTPLQDGDLVALTGQPAASHEGMSSFAAMP